MAMLKKLAVLAAAAEAARRYAKKNPDQTSKYVDQAAEFVNKQTKGKYHGHISGAAQKAKSAAGIDRQGPAAGVDSPGPAASVDRPGPVAGVDRPGPATAGVDSPGPVTP
jgi:MT0933-like antitoxin protein